MNKYLKIIIILAIIVVAFLVFKQQYNRNVDIEAGAVSQGQAYYSTITTTGLWTATTQTLKTGPGEFGSVTITGAGAGVINIYDATTTDVTKRTGQTATATIYIASIPASAAAGTYSFDTTFNTALLVDIIGTVPTTTITWR